MCKPEKESESQKRKRKSKETVPECNCHAPCPGHVNRSAICTETAIQTKRQPAKDKTRERYIDIRAVKVTTTNKIKYISPKT